MRKTVAIFIITLITVAFAKAQLVYPNYQDGIIYFKLNEVNYYYNTKTQFIFKSDNKNKYSYDSSFDPKIKKLIKERYESYKKYNKKIEEK